MMNQGTVPCAEQANIQQSRGGRQLTLVSIAVLESILGSTVQHLRALASIATRASIPWHLEQSPVKHVKAAEPESSQQLLERHLIQRVMIVWLANIQIHSALAQRAPVKTVGRENFRIMSERLQRTSAWTVWQASFRNLMAPQQKQRAWIVLQANIQRSLVLLQTAFANPAT